MPKSNIPETIQGYQSAMDERQSYLCAARALAVTLGKDELDARNGTQAVSVLEGYLAGRKANESIVSDFAAPEFINTTTEAAAGLAKILVRVQTYSHWISLVIDTAIGPNVSIEESDTLPVGA